jgi:hypothetical protein
VDQHGVGDETVEQEGCIHVEDVVTESATVELAFVVAAMKQLWLGGGLSTYSFCKKTSHSALDRAEPQEHNEYMSISKKRSRKAARPVSLAVELGQAIREEREAEGLTLAQLSERSGFDVAELQLMEDGTRIPTQEEVVVLGEALNYHWLRLSHLAFVADQERHPRFVSS